MGIADEIKEARIYAAMADMDSAEQRMADLEAEIAGKDRTLSKMAHQIRVLQRRLSDAGLDTRLPPQPDQ